MTIEQLENLKRLLNNFPQKLALEEYYNGSCYCAVGYMLKNINISNDTIYKLYNYVTDWKGHEEFESLLKLLKYKYGLTTEELREIQDINDDLDIESDSQRAYVVKNYLKSLVMDKEYEMVRGVSESEDNF